MKETGYPLHFESFKFLRNRLIEYGLNLNKIIVITDQNVRELYGESLLGLLPDTKINVIEVSPGESSKSFDTYASVMNEVLTFGIERGTPLIALGGGVVGDLAGFVASSALRGIPFIQIPTTLVAQVDSAIGGKTGINHREGKNLIGAFYQPKFILTDTTLLETLPKKEWIGGMAEVVKHALILDKDFYSKLGNHASQLLQGKPFKGMVEEAASIKVKIVQEDALEKGRRALLNFGHTFGHAIERVTNYETFIHGEAVFLGMKAALYLSAQLYPQAKVAFQEALIFLEDYLQEINVSELSLDSLQEAMFFDKKIVSGKLRLIVLQEIGKAVIRDDVPDEQIRESWEFLLHHS